MTDPAEGSRATSVAGVALEHPVLNAAGTAKSLDDVRRMARAPVAAVTVGSITVQPRDGNAGEVYASRAGYAVNALGMPNRGAAFYRRELPAIVDAAHAEGKPLIVSVAGFSAGEYGDLAEVAAAGGADLVELNLGCPNVWDGGEQKRIMSFDPVLVERAIAAAAAVGAPVGVKLSPISDPVLLAEVAHALESGGARFVVTANTFPNGLVLRDDGRPVIDVGFGGVSGAAMKPVALGQVAQLRTALDGSVDIVGCGGVRRGDDVRDLLCAGATAVGLATAFWDAGEEPGVFGDLLADWLT